MEHNADLYMTPLRCQMLLEMEFLHYQKASLDFEHDTLTMGEETVTMMFRRPEEKQDAQVF